LVRPKAEGKVTEPAVVSIVDDDQSVRDGILDLVRAIGFDAEAFERAEQFLQSSRRDRTSCLITDARMPGMTGIELHDRLIASSKPIPTIIITAFPRDGDRARALEAGVLCYLVKPVDEKELLTCIKTALASNPSLQGAAVSNALAASQEPRRLR
jgi:FixJ family two-component response regulator